MKRVLNTLLIFSIAFTALQAQKAIQGTVEYTYTITGDESGMMAGMMPSKMIVVYGDDAMLTYMEGGVMANLMGKVIVNKGESYVVKEDAKTVYEMTEQDRKNAMEEQKAQASEATKVEGEMKTIMGYSCQLYEVQMNQEGQNITQKVWVTNQLKVPEMSGIGTSGLNQGVLANFDIPGFPMKVEVDLPPTEMKMVLQVSEINKEKPNADLFKKPSGFKVKPFSEMLQMGGN
ncbi:MAG: DUF4412 domain-containing protein [Saprospiraceae bacterium]|nr:DUF4412 domain-containing protein [Saprospiraceae bacterium]